MKFRQSYNQANAAISPGSGGGVQGGLQGHCHVLLLEFALLACLLAFRCANLEQSFIFAKCFATLLVTAVLVSYFLAFWACFMPPRRMTRNSLNSFFDMAESANSTADVPVSSALPASIPLSGDQANVFAQFFIVACFIRGNLNCLNPECYPPASRVGLGKSVFGVVVASDSAHGLVQSAFGGRYFASDPF